jgi:hypothetical protein
MNSALVSDLRASAKPGAIRRGTGVRSNKSRAVAQRGYVALRRPMQWLRRARAHMYVAAVSFADAIPAARGVRSRVM